MCEVVHPNKDLDRNDKDNIRISYFKLLSVIAQQRGCLNLIGLAICNIINFERFNVIYWILVLSFYFVFFFLFPPLK